MTRLLHLLTAAAALLVWTPAPASGNIVNCGFCVCERSSITCDFDAVKTRIKENVQLADFVPTAASLRTQSLDPLTFEDLYVNCKNSRVLLNQRITKELLEPFSNMKKVAIVRCDLTAIDPEAFQRLYKLEEFDASDNNLARLPPRLFGLRRMTHVKLSENRQLQLDAQTFFGLTLKRLILTRCELRDFPLAAIFPIEGLRELTLSENRIRFVPSEAMGLIRKLAVLYLDDNPISCTCANKWLRESVNWDTLSPSVIRKSKLPTCKSPFNLMDIELTKVDPARFRCSPPRITDVELELGADSAQLRCSVAADVGTDEPQPQPQQQQQQRQSLTWSYQHLPGGADAAYTFPVLPVAESGPLFVKSLKRTPGFAAEKLVVYVRNSEGQSSSFNVSVEWPPVTTATQTQPPPPPPQQPRQPPRHPPPPPPPAQAVTVGPALTLLPPAIPEHTGGAGGIGGGGGVQPDDYYAAKQFTLVEMIVAVIGTFMATSLVFLLACQFARWYRRRDRKRWLPSGYGQHGYSAAPAGGVVYGYSPHQAIPHQAAAAAAAGSLSQHEYDVPRIDQPCLPKLPSNGGGGGVGGSSEFLDFTNPRLKYNV